MIPYKLFGQLTDRLTEYRTNPCGETAQALDQAERQYEWPWNASSDQLLEWAAICSRTRAEFDFLVTRQQRGLR